MKFLKSLIVIALVLSIPAFAAHTSAVAVSPQLTGASKETDFFINVTNKGKDSVNEVRIRVPVEFSTLKCGTAPNGWALAYSDAIECNYKTVSNYITSSHSALFNMRVTTAGKDGNYTWEVRSKDVADDISLHNPVTFIDVAPPSIKSNTIEVPNGGESWDAGSQHNILWHLRDITDSNLLDKPVMLEYTTDGKTWNKIAETEENDGAYPWTVPDMPTDNARVRITVTDKAGNTASDESDGPFSIAKAMPTVTIGVGETKVVNNTKITLKSVSADVAVLAISIAAPAPAPVPTAKPNVTANATANITGQMTEKGVLANPTVTAIIVILILIILYLIWRLQQLEKKKK